ncbi:transcription factor jumonji [Cavenderia fasciculata]|uniref:Transcription factor jumonji n=1 Tax=Cavenderia fasciculata TaxID=261658 RepID=F4PQW0_CACFS|nr:transcription factor jumonji [Cavenderia fasciculata]EGG21225.1 transcription factor jumonji [Cavenderia fasciculata]|eukprot:XP_004359075.1 transcription factor jumonji [Cavenderia fasciculata]
MTSSDTKYGNNDETSNDDSSDDNGEVKNDIEDKYNDILSTLARDSNDFYVVHNIERIDKPTPLVFYRDYVAQNKPVIIQSVEITVAITPDGLGDAVKPINTIADEKQETSSEHPPPLYFVKPLEKKMKFEDYLDATQQSETNNDSSIHYLQFQNGSFNLEYQQLWNDIDHSCISFASEAFDETIDAINFWMGEDRSISSLHKDPYENIYWYWTRQCDVVVRGTKIFTLLPPTDFPFLYESEFKPATYQQVDSSIDGKQELKAVLDEDQTPIPWIPVDPTHPIEANRAKGYGMVERCHPLHVEVKEGEILYLPSLYYHRVAQRGDDKEHKTIAINYWFDMKYGPNYVYYQFLRQFNKPSYPSTI